MEGLWDDITRAYDAQQVPGKEIHFLILVAFLCSFGFNRASAHLIRAQVSWWPGKVETKGGTHIHHLVRAILLLLVMGYLGLAVNPASPWLELVAIAFGIGVGLTLDEFALCLNLEDVYWEEKGAPVDRRRGYHGLVSRRDAAWAAVLDRRDRSRHRSERALSAQPSGRFHRRSTRVSRS